MTDHMLRIHGLWAIVTGMQISLRSYFKQRHMFSGYSRRPVCEKVDDFLQYKRCTMILDYQRLNMAVCQSHLWPNNFSTID